MKTICAWLESASVRTEVLPQNMKALRADERVRFSGLPRTEAGIYPAESTKETELHPKPEADKMRISNL